VQRTHKPEADLWEICERYWDDFFKKIYLYFDRRDGHSTGNLVLEQFSEVKMTENDRLSNDHLSKKDRKAIVW